MTQSQNINLQANSVSKTKVKQNRNSKNDWLTFALKVLIDKGPDQLKIMRLCELKKVSKGSFYHHFSDRAAIIWFLTSGTFWIVFGLTLKKLIAEGFIPPMSLGWSFIVIGIALVIIMPVSGAYLFIVQGALLVYGFSRIQVADKVVVQLD